MPCEVMVDLETLGTNNEAVIVSIGAVKFDPFDDTVPLERFYVTINPESATAHGLKMDAGTVMWWMHPDRAEAREQTFDKDLMLDIGTALEGFRLWFGGESLPVWGNGASFDNVILRNAYAKCAMDAPWYFWHDRCYRTIKSVAPMLSVDTPIERDGTHHNALDDAVTQARHLQRIFKAMLCVEQPEEVF